MTFSVLKTVWLQPAKTYKKVTDTENKTGVSIEWIINFVLMFMLLIILSLVIEKPLKTGNAVIFGVIALFLGPLLGYKIIWIKYLLVLWSLYIFGTCIRVEHKFGIFKTFMVTVVSSLYPLILFWVYLQLVRGNF